MPFASGGTPESPDNKSIRAQLEELKKLNASNKLTVAIAVAALIVSIVGIIIALWK